MTSPASGRWRMTDWSVRHPEHSAKPSRDLIPNQATQSNPKQPKAKQTKASRSDAEPNGNAPNERSRTQRTLRTPRPQTTRSQGRPIVRAIHLPNTPERRAQSVHTSGYPSPRSTLSAPRGSPEPGVDCSRSPSPHPAARTDSTPSSTRSRGPCRMCDRRRPRST